MSSEQTWLTVGILCDVKKPFEKITAGQIRPLSGKTEEVLCSRLMILSFANCGKPPEPCQVEGCRSDYDGGLRLCVCVYRNTAACVTVAMAVLHPGSSCADGQSAEASQSGPLGSSGRWECVHECFKPELMKIRKVISMKGRLKWEKVDMIREVFVCLKNQCISANGWNLWSSCGEELKTCSTLKKFVVFE